MWIRRACVRVQEKQLARYISDCGNDEAPELIWGKQSQMDFFHYNIVVIGKFSKLLL